MSIYGAMFAGVSGLSANSQALGAIADNITNVNTIGYKTNQAAFSTLVTRSTGDFHAPGGVRSSVLSAIDRQGLLQASSNATDLAISGNGVFVGTQQNAPTANDTRYYTRAGQFSADAQGFLRSPAGFYLQGWRTDANGVPTTTNLSALNVLAHARKALDGDLDRILQVARLRGYVNCVPAFVQPNAVVNGASDLMVEVFGDAGRHARTVAGVPSMPFNVAIEVEAEFLIG